MELQKQPVTEMEYWQATESLGSYIFYTQHDYSHGRIEDPSALVSVSEASQLQQRLAAELSEKFGIILPPEGPPMRLSGNYEDAPAPPEGKRWYWPWYYQMKFEWLKSEYEKLVCSACPLSTGDLETFSREIPCSVFPGSLFQLHPPSHCGMLKRIWTRAKLEREIVKAGGPEALAKFKAKEAELVPVAVS